MQVQENKPIDGESISFRFVNYGNMLAIVLSLWFTCVG
jgi:hypothetical protein